MLDARGEGEVENGNLFFVYDYDSKSSATVRVQEANLIHGNYQ